MNFCKVCNEQLPPNSKFCISCGAKVESEVEANVEANAEVNSEANVEPQETQPIEQEVQSEPIQNQIIQEPASEQQEVMPEAQPMPQQAQPMPQQQAQPMPQQQAQQQVQPMPQQQAQPMPQQQAQPMPQQQVQPMPQQQVQPMPQQQVQPMPQQQVQPMPQQQVQPMPQQQVAPVPVPVSNGFQQRGMVDPNEQLRNRNAANGNKPVQQMLPPQPMPIADDTRKIKSEKTKKSIIASLVCAMLSLLALPTYMISDVMGKDTIKGFQSFTDQTDSFFSILFNDLDIVFKKTSTTFAFLSTLLMFFAFFFLLFSLGGAIKQKVKGLVMINAFVAFACLTVGYVFMLVARLKLYTNLKFSNFYKIMIYPGLGLALSIIFTLIALIKLATVSSENYKAIK